MAPSQEGMSNGVLGHGRMGWTTSTLSWQIDGLRKIAYV